MMRQQWFYIAKCKYVYYATEHWSNTELEHLPYNPLSPIFISPERGCCLRWRAEHTWANDFLWWVGGWVEQPPPDNLNHLSTVPS